MTEPGRKRLSEVAKHLIVPAGLELTGWPDVSAKCREKLGIEFDGWQESAGHLILGKRADGTLAATVGGVGMSLPRQIGKTWLLTGLIFGLCLNQPGLLVIWTSHHQATTGETFLWMYGFTQREQVAPYIDRVYLGSGDEEVRFRNGSRILFGARERGFGRGIPGVDALVFDEAQILSERALQNMLATMNTSRLGLHVYCGTPPRPEDNSEAFRRMREDALSGESDDVVWIECGAPDGADVDDRRVWAVANCSLGSRTPIESFERLRRKLDRDGFRREALGMWDPADESPVDVARWAQLVDVDAEPPGRVALVVDVSPDRRWSTIGVAGDLEDGRTLVMVHSEPGTEWVTPKLVELCASKDIVEVALFTGGQAACLQPDLTRSDIPFVKLNGADMGSACCKSPHHPACPAGSTYGQRSRRAPAHQPSPRRTSPRRS